jgi:hypothetical protein
VQNNLAGQLPDALYGIYCAATAYARAHPDVTVDVEIHGSPLDGEAFDRETAELSTNQGRSLDSEASSTAMDVDDRHGETDTRPLDREALLQPHPMTVDVAFGMCGGLCAA